MKVCSKCKEKKSLLEFNKNSTQKDGYQKYCKSCKKISDKKWYKDNPSVWKKTNQDRNIKIKNLLLNFRQYLGGKCKKCGESRDHLLDFHHISPLDKVDTISNILIYYGYSKKAIKKAQNEVDKCLLLCANCHRDFHFQEKNNNLLIEDYLIEK